VGENNVHYDNDLRSSFLMNTKITDIKKSDVCLLIGANPRLESPLLNIRLRRQFLKRENFYVFTIGPATNLTYYSKHLGNNIKVLLDFVEGRHSACKTFLKAKNPLVFVGSSFFERNDYKVIYKLVGVLAKYTNLKTEN